MSIPLKRPQTARSLIPTLVIAFVVLSVGVLLVSGGSQLFFSIQTQQETIANKQQLIAQDAAKTVTSFIQEKFGVLETAVRLVSPTTVSPEAQQQILGSLLGLQPAFRQLVLFDAQDQIVARASRMGETVSEQFADQLEAEVLSQTQQQPYISPVYIDPTTSEPLVIITVPAVNALGDFQGTLAAEVNLKFMWDLVDQLREVETGRQAYVVDRQGNLIAFWDNARILRGENVSQLKEVGEFINSPSLVDETGATIAPGIDGTTVVGTYVPLGTPDWAVVTELPWTEAYREVINSAVYSVVVMIFMAAGASLIGVVLARRLAVPLVNLTDTATQIAEGELDLEATVKGPHEVMRLGEAFNSMTARLRDFINTLEERVTDRTYRLEIVATLGEQLNAILDPNDLLQEVVNQIKANFGYYHTHIYLLDEAGETLAVAAGTGSAGEEMAASGHRISLDAAASPVARAARSGEIVTVDNVQKDEDWLPNPLLPDTRAEMAVPIIQKSGVIGVLDVQEDKIGGLDESDANLLRSLANQVAVALSNARLFTETTQAKEAAELAQKDIEIANTALEAQVWQTAGQAQLSNRMRGEQNIPTLADNVIEQLCHYLGAQIGALYVVEDGILNLIGSYAYANKNPATQIKFGQGLVGQAARKKQPLVVTDVPDDYITVSSGLGEAAPRHILLYPFVYEDQVAGVVEMGTLTEFSETQIEFLQTALSSVAIAFNTAQARARINELLHETQQQAEELQAQGEELRVANEELEAQTESLRASEAQLRKKQAVLDEQNRELTLAQQELEKKAEELALSSKYKSEFLANMSHELRTPLNSLLILARMLRDNDEGNLTEEQIESAQVIYGSGNDLLSLINDILDLSKVEAGKMTFNIEPMPLTDLVAAVRTQFAHVAEEKELDLNITLADDLPDIIETDPQRVGQIVKNLLSNAFKFTSEGSVSLDIYRPDVGTDLSQSGLDPSQAIAIRVTDSGIGMTPEQQKIVFEAFQQADGSTSRKYGGSGLGLAISRELSTKLGGRINLTSEVGKGSTFTLYLPIGESANEGTCETAERAAPAQLSRVQKAQDSAEPARSPLLPDDRDDLEAGDRVLLVIEDDPKFAEILYDYAHQQKFKGLIAGDGRTGLELVKTYHPEAVILDLNLPDISGWEVLETLKRDPDTRHIPVHIMSVDEEVLDAYRKGAMGYLTKPVSRESLAESFQSIEQFLSREIKTLLLVEDDAKSRRSIKKLLGGSDVQIVEADRGQAALDLLKSQRFDCMIVDLNLPDMTGFQVLSKMNGDRTSAKCPVIVYTGRDLTPEENHELMKHADSVIVKGVKSPERLLDETALFLHRVVADMPKAKQQTIKQLYNGDGQLEGKKVLIVDDDMRNSFALSKLLSDKGIDVKIAQSGQKALDLLAEHPDTDLVLMDIMMPVMDGYEATQRIRAQQEFQTLPILALTAKAMKGDREKCLEAGASDYLPKPVDVDRLFSMLRVWLYQ